MAKLPDTVLHVDRAELDALASTKVTIAEQGRLDELLGRNSNDDLSLEESTELDLLLDRIDRLNLVKAKALVALRGLDSKP